MKPHQDAKNGAAGARQHGVGGRAERRRRRSPGDLEALRRECWWAIRRVGEALDDPDLTVGDLCKVAHALAGLANSYGRVVEVGDLAARLEALEADRGVNA